MKIPKTFLPENKNLEEKLKQLEEGYKAQKQNLSPKIEETELNKVLKNIQEVRNHELYSQIRPLLEKSDYTLMKSKKRYEYWIKPADFDEKNLFIRLKDDPEHYMFSIVEENKLEKFCKKFEDESKKLPLNVVLTSVAIAAGATSSVYFSFCVKNGIPMMPIVGVLGAVVTFVAAIRLMEYFAKNIHEKNKKNTEKYCRCLIRNEKEALEAAFS
jgi:hypothetical protein